ncbi:MAG: 16S rRNA (guanine(966)-N(2))-methyltransferase RsmD [Clostridia bacterium]|nr:16S rRNA (guanine(966)-N(2))-methyltransferase RsmD [Clostridia bacterium]
MRIIAGNYKGKKIKSVASSKTRPTLDRVKEAIFSMVSEKIDEAVVLDLFGGTGAISIEFLSRGAKFCYINDVSKEAVSTILYNIKALTNCSSCVKITLSDYMKCLKKLSKEEIKFDIVFLDPPYESKYAWKVLEYISENKGKILNDGGIIIYEYDKSFDTEELNNISHLECIKTRFYGRVAVRLFKWRD